jgi:RNA binding exosome subunit
MLFVSFFSSGCRQQDDRAPEDKTNLAAGLSRLVPQGWTLYDEIRRFTAENLYEKIDGRAEFYLAYDMVEMTFAGFENPNDDSQFIDISVYDMGAPTRAFGVFSSERSHEGMVLKLGRDAYRSGANCYIWKGKYYIQVISSDITDELARISLDLARRTTDLVADSGETVWGLNALPQQDRVAGSERYFLVDAMGLDFMRNTYMAEYRTRGTIVSVFLSQFDSLEEARKAMTRYFEHASRYGKKVRRTTVEGVDLTECDMNGNTDVFFQKQRLVAGVTAVARRDDAVRASVELWKKLPDEWGVSKIDRALSQRKIKQSGP